MRPCFPAGLVDRAAQIRTLEKRLIDAISNEKARPAPNTRLASHAAATPSLPCVSAGATSPFHPTPIPLSGQALLPCQRRRRIESAADTTAPLSSTQSPTALYDSPLCFPVRAQARERNIEIHMCAAPLIRALGGGQRAEGERARVVAARARRGAAWGRCALAPRASPAQLSSLSTRCARARVFEVSLARGGESVCRLSSRICSLA